MEMATHPLPAPQIDPRGRGLVTDRHSQRAAGREAAAGRHPGQRWHLPDDRFQPGAAPCHVRQRGKEFLRIGVTRLGEEAFARGFLDDFPGVHHADALRHLRHHAQIVRDQQHPHATLGLQAAQEIENLRLNGHVKRGGRLVGNQQARLAGQCHGDHHPLLHATGKLERIFAQASWRIGNPYRL